MNITVTKWGQFMEITVTKWGQFSYLAPVY